MHVYQHHMLQSPAACFLKSNRWTSAEGDARNSLHLSDSTKTLYACAATGDLTFIVDLSPSCRGLQFHVRTFIRNQQALGIRISHWRKNGLISPYTLLIKTLLTKIKREWHRNYERYAASKPSA